MTTISMIILIAIVSFILGLITGAVIVRNDYKKGQIDALTGYIKYQMVEHADRTKTWERKEASDER